MLTVIAAGEAFAPVFVELNRTHATNPCWPGHARFHLVWQVFSHILYSVAALTLLWLPSARSYGHFQLAALLLATPLLAFLIALLARRIYHGTLHDPNGVQPLWLRIGRWTIPLEMNFVLVVAGLAVLAAAVSLAQLSGADR